jgi:uncharacterized membrane protein YfhO
MMSRRRSHDGDRITAQLQAPGLVVLTDQPWPGWHVEVDGGDARLWSVNAALHRAVLVPAGSHRVRVHYFPSTLRWGLVVSLTALALTVPYLVWGARSGARASVRSQSREACPAD